MHIIGLSGLANNLKSIYKENESVFLAETAEKLFEHGQFDDDYLRRIEKELDYHISEADRLLKEVRDKAFPVA
jgi:hypothetical protein